MDKPSGRFGVFPMAAASPMAAGFPTFTMKWSFVGKGGEESMDVMHIVGEPFPWLNVPSLVLLPPLTVFLMRKYLGHRPHFRGQPRHGFITLLFFTAVSLMLMLAFFNAFIRPLHELDGFIPPYLAPVLLVWCGLNLGATLYTLREARRDVYGGVEIVVAAITLVVTASEMAPETFGSTTIGFVGGVYVLVRGMTNFSEGRSARPGSRA